MKKIWGYVVMLFIGIVSGLIIALQMLKGSISNNEISINKPKQKNNQFSNQDFNSSLLKESGENLNKKKRKLNFIKKRRSK
jgi:hypothetical protein